MSEEKKLEKWEKGEWFIFKYDIKLGFLIPAKLRRKALDYGKIVIEDDKLSIGHFILNFTHITRFEKENNFYIIAYHLNGKKYRLYMNANSPQKIKKSRNKVFPILFEKLKQYEDRKIPNARDFLKSVPNLYKEITINDLILKTGLQENELLEIIEDLLSNRELKAEIRGNVLKFRRKAEILVSPEGYTSETSTSQEGEKREGMLIFVSYATKDAELYKIPELAHKLESYKEIGEVLYWQEDMHDSIIEYMNDNLGRCDVVLLFCSPNALDSVPVKKEWMAAESLNKPIIPIFFKPEHIPPLLNDRLGIEFDNFNFQKNVQEMYELILKKKEN
ncbi:MAG: toll/interleukin-1 receptor domain-containing protein [Promethearchaeota archaeon]